MKAEQDRSKPFNKLDLKKHLSFRKNTFRVRIKAFTYSFRVVINKHQVDKTIYLFILFVRLSLEETM